MAAVAAGATPPRMYLWRTPTNVVFGAGLNASWVLRLGPATNATACEQLCQASPKCNAFTWHDQNQGKWKNQCVGRQDTLLIGEHQDGHFSGCKSGADLNCGPLPPAPSPPGPKPHGNIPADFNCEMRKFASVPASHTSIRFDSFIGAFYTDQEYGQYLLPHVNSLSELLHDALELKTACPDQLVPRPPHTAKLAQGHPLENVKRAEFAANGPIVYVDSVNGADSNPGTVAAPLKTIGKALAWSRDPIRNSAPRTILLLAGTHVLAETATLTAVDSELTITSTSGAIVSGGVALGALTWQPAGGSFAKNVLVAKLPEEVVAQLGPVYQMTQLFVDEDRAVRARHPNANFGKYFRTGRFASPTGFFQAAKSWTRSPVVHASSVVKKTGLLNTTRYADFVVGYGGPVEQFEPPAAYWAVDDPPAGGGCKYEVPSGLVYDASDFANVASPETWTTPTSAIVHAFHRAYWGDWAFAVSEVDAKKHSIHWKRGGFQEARGSCGRGGHDWYIEGVKELLDAPGEWWFDDSAKELYYYFNDTSMASEAHFVASKISTLFSINGSQTAPVKRVTIANLTFAHTRPTFMDNYEVPSAGDWSIHRGGTVFAQGVDDFTLDACTFRQVGGNGVCVSQYSRNTAITRNVFNRIGDSAVLVVGASGYYGATPWIHNDGEYPINTLVAGNLATELGIFTKQTAFFFQALGWNSTVQGNVVFNGPRSGININDASFGGNIVKNNLLFNLVRETVDHGPFNTWSRQPYLTNAVDPNKLSAESLMSHVNNNFFICSYGAVKGIDHDDGSGFYSDHENFMPLCSGKMKGQVQSLYGNVYLYPQWSNQCMHVVGGMDPSRPFFFENNTCVNPSGEIYASSFDVSSAFTKSNTYYIPGGLANPNFPFKKGNWSAWQATGEDAGSVVYADTPTASAMMTWGRILLGVPHENSGPP